MIAEGGNAHETKPRRRSLKSQFRLGDERFYLRKERSETMPVVVVDVLLREAMVKLK
jgi:hypothetical protein